MIFKTKQKIQEWAGTTFINESENFLQVKKHPEGIFHWFWWTGSFWELKMTSLDPYFFDPSKYK